MANYVTKTERKVASTRARKIIKDLQKKLRPKYRIDPRLVGSAKYNTIVCNDNGIYDMDYQLILTNNCKCYDADEIRKDFIKAFNDIKAKSEKVENSTSVITVRVSDSVDGFDAKYEKFSFDFAIVMENDEGSFITRRNGDNQYTWNQLPSKNSKTYKKFYSFNAIIQKQVIDKVIERKIEEKKKPKDSRVPSQVIFIDAINQY